MKIVRNDIDSSIEIINDFNIKIFEAKFIADEFVILICDTIRITKDLDEVFYNNLDWLMNNNYQFSNKYSFKKENIISFLSDESYDIDNELEVNRVNKLIIKKENDIFYISYDNPYFRINNIPKDYGIVVLSPGGNGCYSRNLETNSTFQDDFIIICRNTLNKNKVLQK